MTKQYIVRSNMKEVTMRARVCPDTTSSTFSWGRTRSRRSAHTLPTLILQWRPLGIHNKAREWISSQVWHMAAVFNPFRVTDNKVLYTEGHALRHLSHPPTPTTGFLFHLPMGRCELCVAAWCMHTHCNVMVHVYPMHGSHGLPHKTALPGYISNTLWRAITADPA